MVENFNQRTNDLFFSYKGDLSKDEIITLASIIELEASRFKDRRMIAGVLLNRLELHMPLQVDVSFLFISGKHTFQLSNTDLSSDDPLNTYKYTGIPPIPITNPSRKSIEAVMNPIESDNLYFLADFYGNTYYSATYAEHLAKKAKYIDSVLAKRRRSSKASASFKDIDTANQETQNAAGVAVEEQKESDTDSQVNIDSTSDEYTDSKDRHGAVLMVP